LGISCCRVGLRCGILGYIILCTPAARWLVEPGPEYFERHLGHEVFFVPWLYALGSGRNENPYGFSVDLCMYNMRGYYDNDCHFHQRVQVLPKDAVFTDLEVGVWRSHGSELIPEGEYDGYQSYGDAGLLARGGTHVAHYYMRKDLKGQLTRLVICRTGTDSFCSHHVLVRDYWFRYEALLTEGDMLDGKLAALVDSWRRN
jgi:hypothetical protein